MCIPMSCLIIKTVNLAVNNAVVLAPGVFWLEDVSKKFRNFQILSPYSILKDMQRRMVLNKL